MAAPGPALPSGSGRPRACGGMHVPPPPLNNMPVRGPGLQAASAACQLTWRRMSAPPRPAWPACAWRIRCALPSTLARCSMTSARQRLPSAAASMQILYDDPPCWTHPAECTPGPPMHQPTRGACADETGGAALSMGQEWLCGAADSGQSARRHARSASEPGGEVLSAARCLNRAFVQPHAVSIAGRCTPHAVRLPCPALVYSGATPSGTYIHACMQPCMVQRCMVMVACAPCHAAQGPSQACLSDDEACAEISYINVELP